MDSNARNNNTAMNPIHNYPFLSIPAQHRQTRTSQSIFPHQQRPSRHGHKIKLRISISLFLIHRLRTVSHFTTSSKIRTLLERVRWHGTGSFEIFCSAFGTIFLVKDNICSSKAIQFLHIFFLTTVSTHAHIIFRHLHWLSVHFQ